MTDITAQLIKIQSEEVDYRSAVSEGTMTRIGAAINWIVENTSQHVGDVQASMLTEAQFQAKRNTTWVLMDGRDVTGSDYATLTGNSTIPDARATVLRMKDNGRTLDPSGDPVLGAYQADTFGTHRHQVATTQSDDFTSSVALSSSRSIMQELTDSGGAYRLRAQSPFPEPTVGRTSASGSSETRAKSTIINYFIKIND
jgi:hypothetical protein